MPSKRQAKDIIENAIALAPEFHNAAVARCCKAWNRVFKANQKAGTNPVLIYIRANEAFRFAMPPLSTPQDLCDFVACVTHALVLNVIPMEHAAALMDGARVASRAFKLAANPAGTPVAPGRKRKNKISGCETVDWDFAVVETTTYPSQALGNTPESTQK